jgi:hypothetical protein
MSMDPASYPYDLGLGGYLTEKKMLPFSVDPRLSSKQQSDVLFWLRCGLIWNYAFHHEEAFACFLRALEVGRRGCEEALTSFSCAMLCYAMLCYAMLCYAMLCYAMLCYAMLCYAMLCYANTPHTPHIPYNIMHTFTGRS